MMRPERYKRDIQFLLRKMASLATTGSFDSITQKKIFKSFDQSNLHFNQAIFNFCVDFEWGLGNAFNPNTDSDLSLESRIKDYQIQKENFIPFITMLEKLQFKTSFALILRMLDDDHVPEEPLRFNPSWSPDWYQGIKSYVGYKPFTLDMFTDLLDRKYFEILSHGYAHIDYQDESTSEDIARYDMERAKEILLDKKIPPCGFVYPCNKLNYQKILFTLGYQIVRGDGDYWRRENDLVITPIGFWVSPGMYSFSEIKSIIDYGVRKKVFIHPWMHLNECNLRLKDIDRFYYPLFDYIKELEAKGKLKNCFFNELVSEVGPYEF